MSIRMRYLMMFLMIILANMVNLLPSSFYSLITIYFIVGGPGFIGIISLIILFRNVEIRTSICLVGFLISTLLGNVLSICLSVNVFQWSEVVVEEILGSIYFSIPSQVLVFIILFFLYRFMKKILY